MKKGSGELKNETTTNSTKTTTRFNWKKPTDRQETTNEFWERLFLVMQAKKIKAPDGGPMPKVCALLGFPRQEFSTQWAAAKLGSNYHATYMRLRGVACSSQVLLKTRIRVEREQGNPYEIRWKFEYGAVRGN